MLVHLNLCCFYSELEFNIFTMKMFSSCKVLLSANFFEFAVLSLGKRGSPFLRPIFYMELMCDLTEVFPEQDIFRTKWLQT